MKLLVDLLLAAVCVMFIGLQKAYSAVPLKELKRRARKGDQTAKLLYRAASYGSSLRSLLWVMVVGSSAVFFIVLGSSTSVFIAFLASAVLVWLAFVWLPSSKVTSFSLWIAARLAPVLAWLLNFLHPAINAVVSFVRRHRPVHVHTGIYEKQDLLDLLKRQYSQTDNRIDKVELEIAAHALKFGEKLIRDVMIPKRGVQSISADETTGPLIIDELHKSGHSRFPVYEGKKDNIVGILYLRDLVDLQKQGLVKSLMHPRVAYVHEDKPLNDVLQASLKMHQQMLIVVNEFEEYAGIVTMEDVLEQIIGQSIIDEFDQYEDLRAVVAREAKKEHAEHQEVEASPTEKKDDKITPDDNSK